MKKLQNLIHDLHDLITSQSAIVQLAILFCIGFLFFAGIIALAN
jgi:hypothetical protein